MAKAKSISPPRRPRTRLGVVLPLVFFAALTALFFVALFSDDPSKLPSALIGKPVPEFTLPPVEGLKNGADQVPGFTNRDLAQGEVSLVNVWASWCGPCHIEHPFLTQLAERGDIAMYGLNYKDNASAARRFLGRYGNPYKAVGQDDNGRIAINWGRLRSTGDLHRGWRGPHRLQTCGTAGRRRDREQVVAGGRKGAGARADADAWGVYSLGGRPMDFTIRFSMAMNSRR